jgi:phosphate starvation-inducible protein PhoH and related proteins
MATKKAPRRRKELDITDEITDHYKKNFDLSNIDLKKLPHLTDNQIRFYQLTQNPKTNVVFVDGVAGTAKTQVAVYGALELLKNRQVDKIIYVRTIVESSSRSIGALPGEIESKVGPYAMPLIDKLSEMTSVTTYKSLIEQEYIKVIPVNFARGLTFHNSAVIVDESQNFSRRELGTIMSRVGRGSRYFIIGDTNQADTNDSGFDGVFKAFDQEFSRKNEIHCLKFDNTDIVRSPILKHIAQILNI